MFYFVQTKQNNEKGRFLNLLTGAARKSLFDKHVYTDPPRYHSDQHTYALPQKPATMMSTMSPMMTPAAMAPLVAPAFPGWYVHPPLEVAASQTADTLWSVPQVRLTGRAPGETVERGLGLSNVSYTHQGSVVSVA